MGRITEALGHPLGADEPLNEEGFFGGDSIPISGECPVHVEEILIGEMELRSETPPRIETVLPEEEEFADGDEPARAEALTITNA